MILADTNVLLDVTTNHPQWADWSERSLFHASLIDDLVINAVIYSELSVGFTRIEEVDAAVEKIGIEVADIPRAALFLAGKTFRTYRQRGGTRSGVLPDFFIGAHAAVSGASIITRDVARYRTYFPTVRLIAPAAV